MEYKKFNHKFNINIRSEIFKINTLRYYISFNLRGIINLVPGKILQ